MIARQLAEAHALEAALAQTLAVHAAVAPRGDLRALLEEHLDVTRAHADALRARLREVGAGPSPARLALGIAQTAAGQAVAAARLPVDLLRGTGGEERLLRHAREDIAAEALAIATYDALAAVAEAAGDAATAALARAHRDDDERFLLGLRERLPALARDAYEATTPGVPGAPEPGGEEDAARAARRRGREAADEVRRRRG
jgi:ferritin-like metal-binding protein YciE